MVARTLLKCLSKLYILPVRFLFDGSAQFQICSFRSFLSIFLCVGPNILFTTGNALFMTIDQFFGPDGVTDYIFFFLNCIILNIIYPMFPFLLGFSMSKGSVMISSINSGNSSYMWMVITGFLCFLMTAVLGVLNDQLKLSCAGSTKLERVIQIFLFL